MGATYAPVSTILVPRLIYPDKPDSGYYARGIWMIKLGIQTAEGVKGTSFALPAPTEAYWNFGWLGVFIVPIVLGAMVGLMLRWGPKDAVVRVGYAVLLATKLGQFLDMVVWIVPAFVAVGASGAFASIYVRVGQRLTRGRASVATRSVPRRT